ncbi:putative lipid-transfer protein DIR1 [Zingiber officinale]|uniref:putative lipid-transfer protein DIR1 n=1 Tax=Zingiber officinale TaxID=94328 RepID=UPI001C4AB879|nr:putative lipid-transfer protein DIR1 [Zingiber officinale]
MEFMLFMRRVAAVVLMLLLLETSSSQAICNMSQHGFDACRPSVTPPNPPRPSAECCKALAVADLQCFCSYKSSPLLPALGIDPALAMKLPPKCGLKAPENC